MRTHEADSGNAAIVTHRETRSVYLCVVFALTLGLVMSDFMSRQALTPVFPMIKSAWDLSDTQLGSLNSVVALLVGVLTFPVLLLAGRWGHVKSIILMAALWSLATLACAIATSYGEMLVARALIGVGDAAFGAVALALLMRMFPARMRSSLIGAFTACASFGSVIGMAFGGVLAVRFGWSCTFAAMGLFGILLVVVFGFAVTDRRLSLYRAERGQRTAGALETICGLKAGFATSRSLVCAYLGSGLQLFCSASLWAWMPSFLNRYYAMAPGHSAITAALFVLFSGIGMITCGLISDKVGRTQPARKWDAAFLICMLVFTLLAVAFQLTPGAAQLALIGAAMFLTSGTNGPGGAMVANLTPRTVHASAFALLTITHNLLGTAPGPFFTGFVADRVGLLGALQVMPLVSLLAAAAFVVGKRRYALDLAHAEA